MIYLVIVSFIWAVSFGLIKGNLSSLDSNFIAFARLLLCFLFFVFFIRIKNLNIKRIITLILLGAVQFGLMYIFYIYSYQYLSAWQVALFTIVTPFYVSLINDLFDRKIHGLYMLAALLSILGAGVIVFKDPGNITLQFGFLFMQLSNICFALGQVWYKRIKNNTALKDLNLIPWLYLGALLISAANSVFFTDFSQLKLSGSHLYTLFYLGLIPSGIGFFLWNYGATKVNAGSLAVMNNLKVPLGIAVSIYIFGESADYLRMIIGSVIIIAALMLSEKVPLLKGEKK